MLPTCVTVAVSGVSGAPRIELECTRLSAPRHEFRTILTLTKTVTYE